jgi:hypothetical protein
VVRLYPPVTGFPFRRFLQLAGLRWRYSTPPHTDYMYIAPARTAQKISSIIVWLFVSRETCSQGCCLATTVVLSPVTCNGCTCHNTKLHPADLFFALLDKLWSLLFIQPKCSCIQFAKVCWIWGYYADWGRLSCNGAYLEESLAVWENISTPSSGSRSNPSKNAEVVFLPDFWALLSSFCCWGVNFPSLPSRPSPTS